MWWLYSLGLVWWRPRTHRFPCAVSNGSNSSSKVGGKLFLGFLLSPWLHPTTTSNHVLSPVSSSEIPQGLFQRDAAVRDVSPTHRQSGADSFQTHHLWVLTVLQERGLWLQQPRDGVELGVTEEPPMQCLLVHVALPARGSLPRSFWACLLLWQPDMQQPAWAAPPGPPGCLTLDWHVSLRWWWPWRAAATVPLPLNVAFSPIVLPPPRSGRPSPVAKWTWPAYLGPPWATPTWDLPNWVCGLPDLPEMTFIWFPLPPKYILFFICLPHGWLYPTRSILNDFIVFFPFPLIWVRTFVRYLTTDVYTEFHILQKGFMVQSWLESSMPDKLDVGDIT